MRKNSKIQVGKPTASTKEKLACWRYEDIKSMKKFFLPGGVEKTDTWEVPSIIPCAIIKVGSRQSISLHFQQVNKSSHLEASSEVEEIRATKTIQKIGMQVTSVKEMSDLLNKIDEYEDGRIGKVEICFWIYVKGRKSPIKLSPIQMNIYGVKHAVSTRMNKISKHSLFGPILYCPEWYCLNPYCHSHWHWFPGVPASTSCQGGCIIGGPCQCWISAPGGGGGWAANCPGFKFCWC